MSGVHEAELAHGTLPCLTLRSSGVFFFLGSRHAAKVAPVRYAGTVTPFACAFGSAVVASGGEVKTPPRSALLPTLPKKKNTKKSALSILRGLNVRAFFSC